MKHISLKRQFAFVLLICMTPLLALAEWPDGYHRFQNTDGHRNVIVIPPNTLVQVKMVRIRDEPTHIVILEQQSDRSWAVIFEQDPGYGALADTPITLVLKPSEKSRSVTATGSWRNSETKEYAGELVDAAWGEIYDKDGNLNHDICFGTDPDNWNTVVKFIFPKSVPSSAVVR